MRNWLEMSAHDFGYGRRKRPTIKDSDIKALYAHAKRERKAREKREAQALSLAAKSS